MMGMSQIELRDMFHRAHPEATLVVTPLQWNSSEKLLTAIAGRVPPDVAMIDRFTLAQWASRGALTPLDELAERDGIRKEDYFEATWEESTYEGRLYCIPLNTDTRALFYNKRLFREAGLDPERPPRTWRELEEYADRLTRYDEKGRIQTAGFISTFMGGSYGQTWFYTYLWLNGGEALDEGNTRVLFNDERGVEALEFMVHMFHKYGAEKLIAFVQTGGVRENNPFLAGRVAMVIETSPFVSIIEKWAPDLEYGVADLPYPEDGRKCTWSGGFGLAIPRGCRHPELAWEFVKLACTYEGQMVIGRIGRQMPALKRAAFDPYFDDFPHWRFFANQMAYTRFRPVTPAGALMWDEMARAVDAALLGSATPKEALDRAAARVQEELDRYNNPEPHPPVDWGKVAVTASAAGAALLLAGALALARALARRRLLRREALEGYFFAAPWFLGMAVFTAVPVLLSIVYSFSRYEVLTPAQWVGLSNYKHLIIEDPLFRICLANTLFYTALSVPLLMAGSLGVALLLNAKVRGQSVFRTIYYLPAVVSGVAVCVLWLWIFNPDSGLLNTLLARSGYPWDWLQSAVDRVWGLLGKEPPRLGMPLWLASKRLAKPSLILMAMWGVGGGMVLYLAGLQSVPEYLYEAARIDGANALGQFRHVTLPLLTPTIFFNLIMGVIGSFQVFNQSYIMTGGGPDNATLFYVLYLFRHAFQYFHMGYASAMAWILFVVVLAFTLAQFALARRWVHYEALRK